MTLQMTMTLGDALVAGTMVIAVVSAYYAVKGSLAALTATVGDHSDTIGLHEIRITRHGERIASLDTKVFGRRRSDARDDE